jgi:hypothetical protein
MEHVYKTYESDTDGRVVIYPALYPPKHRGIVHLFRKLVRLVAPENVKGRLGDQGEQ